MKEFTLKNNINAVYKQNKNTPRIALTINIAINKPEKHAGTYSLMNRLLLQGTKKYSNTELAKILDENAIEFCTDMKQDYLRFRFLCLNEDFDLAIEILDDIINNSTFEEFDKEKEKMRGEIVADLDSARVKVSDAFTKTIYENHFYGNTYTKMLENLDNITKEDVINSYKQILTEGKKVIAVVGPTASGKTSYAVEMALKLNGEIVSADSRLVYIGFDIGTAKPSIEEREGIPHHMIDIVEPEVDYSAGLYAQEAEKKILDIFARGKLPIIVGGTGLYFRLLLENYDVPKVEPDYDLRQELSLLSFDELYKILLKTDSVRAAEISKNDKKKIIRAIEIAKHLEKPLSEYKKEPKFDVEWIGLNYPRDILYERINKRVDIMIKDGLVEETEYLLKKHGRIKNIIYTIGYQEIVSYLDNEISLEEAKEKIKQNTRNYAKRQLTWFRKNSLIKWNCEPVRLKK